MIADVAALIHEARARGESLLFEERKALLDIDRHLSVRHQLELHRRRGGHRAGSARGCSTTCSAS